MTSTPDDHELDAMLAAIPSGDPAEDELDDDVLRREVALLAAAGIPSEASRRQALAMLHEVAHDRARAEADEAPARIGRRTWLAGAGTALSAAAAVVIAVALQPPPEPQTHYVMENHTRSVQRTRGSEPDSEDDGAPRTIVPNSRVDLRFRPDDAIDGAGPEVDVYALGPGGAFRQVGSELLERARSGGFQLKAPAHQIVGEQLGPWTVVILVEPRGEASSAAEVGEITAAQRFTARVLMTAPPADPPTQDE